MVRAFGREQFEMDRFREKNDYFAKLWIRLGTLSGLYWGVGDLITGLQVVTVIVLGAAEAVNGHISVGEFIAFASYNTTLVWPIRGLGRILSDMSKAGVSFERVDYIICAREEEYERADHILQAGEDAKKHVDTDMCDIRFEHVNFGYEDGKEVLTDISFHISKGNTFGILGGTGSGKSTIVQLLSLGTGREVLRSGERILEIFRLRHSAAAWAWYCRNRFFTPGQYGKILPRQDRMHPWRRSGKRQRLPVLMKRS